MSIQPGAAFGEDSHATVDSNILKCGVLLAIHKIDRQPYLQLSRLIPESNTPGSGGLSYQAQIKTKPPLT